MKTPKTFWDWADLVGDVCGAAAYGAVAFCYLCYWFYVLYALAVLTFVDPASTADKYWVYFW